MYRKNVDRNKEISNPALELSLKKLVFNKQGFVFFNQIMAVSLIQR